MIESKKINIKELIKGIAIIILYPIILIIMAIPFSLLEEIHLINDTLLYILTYLSTSIIYFIYFKNDIINDFKDFKKNYKHILKKSLFIWFISFIIMLTSSYFIKYFNIPENVNQQANINQFKTMPIVQITCACLFAPFLEELTYRYSMRNFTTNKHAFAIITGLIFAFVHVTSSLTAPFGLIMLVYLIPYGALGIALGYIYKSTNNIFGNIFIHFLHNSISILELLILLLGGRL